MRREYIHTTRRVFAALASVNARQLADFVHYSAGKAYFLMCAIHVCTKSRITGKLQRANHDLLAGWLSAEIGCTLGHSCRSCVQTVETTFTAGAAERQAGIFLFQLDSASSSIVSRRCRCGGVVCIRGASSTSGLRAMMQSSSLIFLSPH